MFGFSVLAQGLEGFCQFEVGLGLLIAKGEYLFELLLGSLQLVELGKHYAEMEMRTAEIRVER